MLPRLLRGSILEWWCTISTTGEKEDNHTLTKMTRLSKSSDDVRKGAWAAEEDEKLRKYVETYGTGHWRSVGKKAGNDSTKKQLADYPKSGFLSRQSARRLDRSSFSLPTIVINET